MLELKIADPNEKAHTALLQSMQKTLETHTQLLAKRQAKERPVKAEAATLPPIMVHVTTNQVKEKDSQAPLMAAMTKELGNQMGKLAKTMKPARPVVATRTVVKTVTPDLSPITRIISKTLKAAGSRGPVGKDGVPWVRTTIGPYSG